MKHILSFKNIDEYTTAKDNDMLDIPNVSFIDLDNKVIYLKVNKCPNCYIKFEDPNILQYILESLGLPADSEGVTYKQASECTNDSFIGLDIYDVTSFNELVEFTNVTELDGFSNACPNVVSVDLSNIISINNASFTDCENLKDLGDTSKVETIIDSFNNCNSLTSINFPNVKTIGGFGAFMDCTNLISINLPKVTTIEGSSFFSCTSLTSINLPNVITIGQSAFSYCNLGGSLNLLNVTTIEKMAFSSCENLISIYLPNVTTIEESVFSDCNNLKSINLPNVTTIEQMAFMNCKNLTSITLPKVTTIKENAFYTCDNLTSLDLPEVITIEDYVFSGCTLTSVNLPKVTTIGNDVFCIDTHILDLPKIEYIGNSSMSIYCDILIIRTENKVCEINNSIYCNNGDPTIYVPDNLVDDYKADANWSSYADFIKPLSEYVENN